MGQALTGCRITLLAENTAGRPFVSGEWGLSLWIEAGGSRILLDTGLAGSLEHNAHELGIDLSSADVLVLSHGHMDHTGGMAAALAARPDLPIYLHPDALLPRFSRLDSIGLEPGGTRAIGLRDELRAALETRSGVQFVTSPTEVAPGVWVTGEIARDEAVEGPGGLGFLDEGLSLPDPIWDDMAVWIETRAGILVLLGCAHAGLINTIRLVQQQNPGKPVTGILGGTHLINVKPDRMAASIGFLRTLPLTLLAPCHCTGSREAFELRRAFPDAYRAVAAGLSVTFPPNGLS